MALNNNDILFASLVGNGVVKYLPQLNVIQNELQKLVLPPIPFLPLRNASGLATDAGQAVSSNWENDPAIPENEQFFPLSLSIDEGNTWFLLPYETMINISGKNNVIKRNVAKWKNVPGVRERIGTVKERWSQDDYSIDITGILMGPLTSGTVDECFPKADFEKLRQVLTHPKNVMVKCPPLELLGINKIVIEDFTFPFTKGESVQAYTIKAVSDYSFNLILT